MSNAANDYIQSLIKENAKLQKENDKLRAKLRSKKPDLKPETVQARREKMQAKWEPGGENYHNSKVYKSYDLEQLAAYHKKYPDAPAGADWKDHIFSSQKKK